MFLFSLNRKKANYIHEEKMQNIVKFSMHNVSPSFSFPDEYVISTQNQNKTEVMNLKEPYLPCRLFCSFLSEHGIGVCMCVHGSRALLGKMIGRRR